MNKHYENLEYLTMLVFCILATAIILYNGVTFSIHEKQLIKTSRVGFFIAVEAPADILSVSPLQS